MQFFWKFLFFSEVTNYCQGTAERHDVDRMQETEHKLKKAPLMLNSWPKLKRVVKQEQVLRKLGISGGKNRTRKHPTMQDDAMKNKGRLRPRMQMHAS